VEGIMEKAMEVVRGLEDDMIKTKSRGTGERMDQGETGQLKAVQHVNKVKVPGPMADTIIESYGLLGSYASEVKGLQSQHLKDASDVRWYKTEYDNVLGELAGRRQELKVERIIRWEMEGRIREAEEKGREGEEELKRLRKWRGEKEEVEGR